MTEIVRERHYQGETYGEIAASFLWDRDNPGSCKVINCANNEVALEDTRFLDEFDVFIRSNKALSIVRKVLSMGSCDSSLCFLAKSRKYSFSFSIFISPFCIKRLL